MSATANRQFLKELVCNFMNQDTPKICFELDPIYELLKQAKDDMAQQPTLLEIKAPVVVVGDLHGQLHDVRRIFHACGFPSTHKYLFLGDYVDRGKQSIELICALLAFRLLYPKNTFLLRGNHEIQEVNKKYGFHDDVQKRWAETGCANQAYRKFNEVFNHMPLAAIISDKILCMHGGLSPALNSLNDIRNLARPIKSPHGLAQDLLWSDPLIGVQGFKPNDERACGFYYGEKDVEERLKIMGLSKMIRAHQCVQYGYSTFAEGRLITVFSASRYESGLYNFGAVVRVEKSLNVEFVLMKPNDFDEHFGSDDLTTNCQSDAEGRR